MSSRRGGASTARFTTWANVVPDIEMHVGLHDLEDKLQTAAKKAGYRCLRWAGMKHSPSFGFDYLNNHNLMERLRFPSRSSRYYKVVEEFAKTLAMDVCADVVEEFCNSWFEDIIG
ncbi:hypothetical protein EVG20_g9705 [Dentipellis fragilis]|uniref:Uncharacterized protein n=1 Tax=Dentipellis fragilis TaxID=205917 RepID=A0A4Y9XW04_9AGAM|nr:hypothetical protein EVG20_g9705 [Dentipellis fragilis]